MHIVGFDPPRRLKHHNHLPKSRKRRKHRWKQFLVKYSFLFSSFLLNRNHPLLLLLSTIMYSLHLYYWAITTCLSKVTACKKNHNIQNQYIIDVLPQKFTLSYATTDFSRTFVSIVIPHQRHPCEVNTMESESRPSDEM